MARIQVLELPEGAGDDRPPFVLVIDECAPQRMVLGVDTPWRDYWQDIADKIGARGAIVTPETIEIPGNEITVPGEMDGTVLRLRIEPDLTGFDDAIGQAMASAQQKINLRLGGAIADAEVRQRPESTGHPVHSDGTPYNYSEIVAEGWTHCDGCGTWGLWTPQEPHQCPAESNVPSA